MLLSITTIVPIALAIISAYAFQRWNIRRAHRAAMLRHGCQSPPKYPHRDAFGIDLIRARSAAQKAGRQQEYYMEKFARYGKTWEEHSFGTRIINTMEKANIQHVAALGFEDFGKPSRKFIRPFANSGIFSEDGAPWKHSRDMIKPIFSRAELSDVDSLEVHVDRLLALIPRDGSTIDLQGPLKRMFLDSASEFLFGQSMDSQLPTNAQATDEFLAAFDASLAGIMKRRVAGVLRHIIFAFDKSWKQAYEKVHAYIDIHVQRALSETISEDPQKASKQEGTPKTRYILLNELAAQTRDPIALRSQLLNIFIPARDTTSTLVSNALFHLARNPAIWTQLRAESLSLGDQKLTFETLKSLQLFRNVINETLRLQGPAGRVQRLAIRDTILPTGGGPSGQFPIFAPKGTIIASSIWGLHHDSDIWGDDVDVFRPGRWGEGKRLPWEFVPFWGGPRTCPAQQQVRTQAVYVLVRLTGAFGGIENRDGEGYVEEVRMVGESRNGVKVALFP